LSPVNHIIACIFKKSEKSSEVQASKRPAEDAYHLGVGATRFLPRDRGMEKLLGDTTPQVSSSLYYLAESLALTGSWPGMVSLPSENMPLSIGLCPLLPRSSKLQCVPGHVGLAGNELADRSPKSEQHSQPTDPGYFKD